jgi:hypothetical protein
MNVNISIHNKRKKNIFGTNTVEKAKIINNNFRLIMEGKVLVINKQKGNFNPQTISQNSKLYLLSQKKTLWYNVVSTPLSCALRVDTLSG